MGSFAGHIDEGVFFIGISLWWMFNIYRDHIAAGCDSSKHKPRLSYPTRIKWNLPIEIVCKTLFPIGGFLAELFDGSPHFYDWQGNFTKLVYMQHMTIYGMFILHGIIDLLDFYRLPVIKGMNYMSVVLCFIWYGIAFYFHSQTHGLDKEPLEIIIHLLPIFLMAGCALASFVEYVKGEGAIWPQLIRTFLVLNLGTWFTNAAFVLYVHDRFPGGETNPNWDRTDYRNVHFMVAAFGMHLNFNMVFMVVAYAAMYVFYWCKDKKPFSLLTKQHQYSKVTGMVLKENGNESVKLLDGDEEDTLA